MLELGKSLALECSVEGFPIHSVVFRHNRRVIKSIVGSSDSVTHLTSGKSLAAAFDPKRQRAKQATGNGPITGNSNGDGRRDSYFVLDDEDGATDQTEAPVDRPTPPVRPSDLPSDSDNSNRLSHVIVIVLEPEHAGAYQCQASNQFETVQSSAYIKVLDDPPKFRETFRAQILEQQRDLSLQCAARANPLPEITWTVDGDQIPESNRIRFGDFVTKVST